jgi:hypothetical protein
MRRLLIVSLLAVAAVQSSAGPLEEAVVVVAGAGDLCGPDCDQTAALLDEIDPAVVFTAGDNAYFSGSLAEYFANYDPHWGRFKNITRPSPGNHEYATPGASGYFDYFNGAGVSDGPAGERGKGYYSYDVGEWHVVALNSNFPMAVNTPQNLWLRQDLAATTKPCTLAYWHHPRFSRGIHGNHPQVEPLWQALQDFRADVIVVGHDHNYQRYAPQTANGVADAENGIRQFVVGTGGLSHYTFDRTAPNFEVGDDRTFGVLELTLSATGYAWRFVPVAGESFTDSGTGTCHKQKPPGFTLALSRAAVSAAQGGDTAVTVTVTSNNGFAEAVELSVAGLPSGVSATFSPPAVTPPADGTASAVLTLEVAPSAAVGRSVLDVDGVAGSLGARRRLRLLVRDGIAPAVPRHLSAEARSRRVVLDWANNTEPDLAGYRVYRRAGPGPFAAIAEVSTSFFRDTRVSNGKTYTYRVTAFDAAGNASAPSAEVAATP